MKEAREQLYRHVGQGHLGSRNSTCKGPEVGRYLMCLPGVFRDILGASLTNRVSEGETNRK